MKTSSGFTLLEVLVAIVVLAVGVLAAASMQTSALSASNRSRIAQEVTNTARTEAERQRQFIRSGTAPATSPANCLSTLPPGYICTTPSTVGNVTVTIVPCRIVSGSNPLRLSCTTTETGPVVADQVTVGVSRPQAAPVSLRTVIAR